MIEMGKQFLEREDPDAARLLFDTLESEGGDDSSVDPADARRSRRGWRQERDREEHCGWTMATRNSSHSTRS